MHEVDDAVGIDVAASLGRAKAHLKVAPLLLGTDDLIVAAPDAALVVCGQVLVFRLKMLDEG